MESCPESSVSTVRKRLIDELTRGRDSADELLSMLCSTTQENSLSAQTLMEKIMDSIDGSLSFLNSTESFNKVSEVLAVDSPCLDGRRSEDSGDICRTSAPKNRRGCYKRRRTAETWTRESHAAPFEDGLAWRKYGQKQIFNTKHPRSYFRCTNKYDQECLATKHVQKIQDYPPIFRTTYHGRHTCKNLLKESQIIMEYPNTANDSSIIWSFQSTPTSRNPSDLVIPTLPTIKQDLHQNKSSSPSNYFALSDLMACESSGLFTAFSSGSDYGDVISSDVYSCTGNTPFNIESEMFVGSVFDDFLEF